ncbi:MAG: glycoside hydrolase family 36 protein [Pseudomonadota bacterium]
MRVLLLLPALSLGCDPDNVDPFGALPTACNDAGCLWLHADGALGLYVSPGDPVLQGATARAMLDDWGEDGTALILADLDCTAGDDMVVNCPGDAAQPGFTWTLTANPDGWFEASLTLENTTDHDLSVAKLSPLYLDGRDGGALFLGDDPATHRILEDGAYGALDFVANLVPGDVERNEGYATVAPGAFEGASVSSWDHAVQDLESERAWVAGALTFAQTTPVVNLTYQASRAQESPDGRTGFSFLAAEGAYLPEPKVVAPGASLTSETFYFWTGADALDGLELYADAIAQTLDLTAWHKRAEGRRVPNGWNSWSGSSSTGGYGTDINEEVILANLEVMATELRDWGVDWFQIDDGYEPTYGEWTWREDRFPHGPAWLTEQIRAQGLTPGLWLAPFQVYPDAPIATDHPDWFADPIPMGDIMLGDSLILDLTHPEVQDYLRELFTTFREDWGFDWLKLDFGYFALLGSSFYQENATREEAWRQGVGVIREALGEDAFFLLVGTLGTNFGILDAGRLGLDSMPIWEWEPSQTWDDRMEQQGLKPTMRTGARRYYFQDRVWVNHPDLIFFRSNTRDESWPRLTLQESQAWCQWVALSGGLVKIGDRLVDLEPEHIDALRRILPAHGAPARPLDLFTREYPERWHLHYDGGLDGFAERWDLVALFDWGFNVDQTENPYAPIADDGLPAFHEVDLIALGIEGPRLAWEFWTGEFLGTVEGALGYEVPSHTGRMIALRPVQDHPQLLGWNRQITMGGVLLGEVTWDADTLTLPMHVAAPTEYAPFTYEIAVHVPEGFTFSEMTSDGVALTSHEEEVEGEVLTVRFVPESTGALSLELAF